MVTKTLPINHTGGGYQPESHKRLKGKLKKSGMFSVVPPSLVGAWLSLKNNNYTIETALCEFIDNILNFNANEKATISIEWYISRKHPNKNILKIKDNAEGIKKDILQVVFTLGRGNNINAIKIFSEHGFGMKAAMLSLGEIKDFKTKSNEEDIGHTLVYNNIKEKHAGEQPDLQFEEFQDDTWIGTEIILNKLNDGLVPDNSRVVSNISTILGSIYASYIDENKLEIKMVLHNLETGKDEYNEIVKSHHRIYAHGTKRDKNGAPVQEPDLPLITLKGGKGKSAWEAKFRAGYKPTAEELFEMTGDTKWVERSPYSPTGNNVGFDVIKHGRTIIFGVMGDAASGRGNYLQGEIFLVKGFSTTTTKDNMRQDKAWKELQAKILQVVKDQRLDDRVKTGMKRVRGTELQITNRIAEELRRDTRMHQYQGVQDPSVEIKAFAELYNSDNEPIGEADILISPTATNNPGPQIYEVKKEEACVDAVRQIFGYMKARNIKDGFIAAQKMTVKAENLMKEYNNNHDVNIKFWDYTQLAIFN